MSGLEKPLKNFANTLPFSKLAGGLAGLKNYTRGHQTQHSRQECCDQGDAHIRPGSHFIHNTPKFERNLSNFVLSKVLVKMSAVLSALGT